MSKYLQPEELTLLLIRLRRHQAKLASIRNYTIAQLLQHLPTNSTYQVSCCVAHLCRMTFCDSANASLVACLSLCFLAHSLVFYNSQVVCGFSLLLYLLWKMSFLSYRALCICFKVLCILPFYTISENAASSEMWVKILDKFILKQNHFFVLLS